MTARLFRLAGVVIASIVMSLVLLIGVELFSSVVHPFPPGFEGTQEEVCDHVSRYPNWVLAAVVPMWGGIAFLGTWLSGKLGNRTCAAIVGSLIASALICNITMLPYPLWFKIVQPAVLLMAILCSSWLLNLHPSVGRATTA